MAYDSENIPLVTRIESGNSTTVNFSVNSEGEGVYKIHSNIDSDFVKSVLQENPAIVDSDIVFNMIREHAASSDISGDNVTLNSPSDGSFTIEPGIISLQTNNTVADAIDRLNEASRNILKNTAVANLDFNGDNLVGGAGFTTTLTTSADGTPNRYDIYWGDGTVDSDSSDSTPSHTYNSNSGSPFTVKVVARNNSGEGAGSFSIKERSNYVIVYTATPVVSFAIYSASSGGSPITNWDDGATVYLQNNTTNTSNSTATYNWNFGDSDGVYYVSNDGQAGGSVNNGGSRLPYTFDSVTDTDRSFNISLTLNTHTTANPADLPIADSDNLFNILDTHTPSVSINDSDGINEEATSGHVIQATNNSGSGIGNHSIFGNQYVYVWGDGTSNTTVNVGSGSAGDRSASPLSHTYALSSSDQANGNTVTYTGELRVVSNHSSSPFSSEQFKITVKPDLRVNLAATADTVSDKDGDNQYSLYNFTDYNSKNRALVTATNTSQNASSYVYSWSHGSNDNIAEDGSTPGSIGHTLNHNYLGANTQSYTITLTGNGSPGGESQTDNEQLTFTLSDPPAAPNDLSSFSLTFASPAQGNNPKLVSGFRDQTSSFTTLNAGDSLNTTTARRYISGTVETNTINNALNGAFGNLASSINNVVKGIKHFNFGIVNETGTFDTLVITQQNDAHVTISSSIYPTGFYQTFDAKISRSESDYSTGLNAQKLVHAITGSTNFVHILRDSLTSSPVVTNAGTLTVNNAGTFRYISGIPYFNSGSPTINVAGITITNLTGEAYCDVSNVVEIDTGTNQESTSSSGTVNTDYSYANIDGSTTMLSSGIPIANVGVGSAYAIGTLSVPITSSSVRTVDRIKIRARNVNGTSSYIENTTNINVHTASQSGINENSIQVSNSLGSTFTDNAVRSAAFKSETTNTPSLRGSSFNYYTTEIFSESADPGIAGTKESTVRLGLLKHDVLNYSTYIPPGPNRSGDTGTQYFTLAFRRAAMANFTLSIVSTTGIEGMFIAAPGTTIDNTSGINGWLNCGVQYAGAGVPGSDTGNGGNGSDGCASTGADVIGSGSLNGSFKFTLGTQNSTNADSNVVLLRIALAANDTVTSLSIS